MNYCDCHIFNVGRGISGAIKTPAGKWVAIDLGASDEFNPVTDFFTKKIQKKSGEDKRGIDQLVISHPHDDHMTALMDFDKEFHPGLLTVPNDNDGMPAGEKIDWDLIENPTDKLTKHLREKMLSGRRPPLVALKDDTKGFALTIWYLPAEMCEDHEDLKKANYPNNISVLVRANYKGNAVLYAGDIMKDGMKRLIEHDDDFKGRLQDHGVDFLIAPHHGLRSSFSTDFFNTIKGNKTALNIVSERPTRSGSNEIVDSRYGDSTYSSGHTVTTKNGNTTLKSLRTSVYGNVKIRLFENGSAKVFTEK